MKKYVAERLEEGCEVYAVNEDKTRYPLPLRLELWNHSPTGFGWGYGGSGPAQLSLAILADFIGPTPAPERCPYCESRMKGHKCSEPHCGYDFAKEDKWHRAVELHQDFKRDVIAHLKEAFWELPGATIQEWLNQHQEDLKGVE